jgi:hypothetical protein
MLWSVSSVTPPVGEAFSARPVLIDMGSTPSRVSHYDTASSYQVAGGVMVESYFPEPGESPESIAAKVDALNAKKAAQSLIEVPTVQQEIPDNQVLVSPGPAESPAIVSPDSLSRSDEPRVAGHPRFKESASP